MFKREFGFIILLLLGIFMVWKPNLLWKITHCFSVKDGEPTGFYLYVVRLIGTIGIVIAVIWAAVYLFSKI